MVGEGREGGGAEGSIGVVNCSVDAVNGVGIEGENGAGGDGNSAGSSSEGFRTYKRRKHANMAGMETKLLEDGKVAADSVGLKKLKTLAEMKGGVLCKSLLEQVNCPSMELGAVRDHSEDCPLDRWRKIVLEQMYQSLGDSDTSFQGLLFHPDGGCSAASKEAVHSSDGTDKCPPQTVGAVNGTYSSSKEDADVTSNGPLNKSNSTTSDLCRRAFFDVVMSEKFAQLCGLLLQNFQGIKVDSFLGINLMNSRMKEGAYERSPMLFQSDMQQLWIKLHKAGTEMVSLAKSLSDKSRTTYSELFRTGESGIQTKPEQSEAYDVYLSCPCRQCGQKAEGRDYLVCDSCEEMYHVSCIQPPVEEIPSKSWYCAKCMASGIDLAHDSCVVCAKLNASTVPHIGIENDPTKEAEHGLQLLKEGKSLPCCNVCQNEVDNTENLVVCGHALCPHMYYHARCLTSKQLIAYGHCWYCPSCLCRGCLTDRDDDNIVLCDGCDHAYHTYCMQPPRTSIPRGKWFCQKCYPEIKRIRKAKKVYEKNQTKLRKSGEDGKGSPKNLESKPEENLELMDKSGGVDMLLNAAKTLNNEEKMAATDKKS
ncbi:PHD finger protein EHD3 isoform X2 [Diospyros lotus]|uniref:PHD finger protein EHD3 isoform X2 n=1 Tax=Diospyros lotus TaxID=55363 RepID=UPI002255A86A|nr:PHD finger protein EHD3 isoform X2 [Diospyros lotus]